MLVDETPWTPRQMLNMHDRQRASWLHPYTCGGGGGPCSGVALIVTLDGLRCPGCNRLQTNAHEADLEGAFPPSPFDHLIAHGADTDADTVEPTVEHIVELGQDQVEALVTIADQRGSTIDALVIGAVAEFLATATQFHPATIEGPDA